MKKIVCIISIVVVGLLLTITIFQHKKSDKVPIEPTASSKTEADATDQIREDKPTISPILPDEQPADGGIEDAAFEDSSVDETPADVATIPEPENDAEFVRVADFIPSIYVELRYATENNFTGQVIYDFSDAYLRYGTVKKLRRVQEGLQKEGYSLKIWDAFRPVTAQYKLWEVYPVDAYVANPNIHYSSHNRGNTVDITMVRSDGTVVEMPTDFDDFTSLADRDYSDCSQDARETPNGWNVL